MSHHVDLALRGGVAFLPGVGLQRCDILITNGIITAIAAGGAGVAHNETVDVAGLTILPGVVDAHIHLGHGMDVPAPDSLRTREVKRRPLPSEASRHSSHMS